MKIEEITIHQEFDVLRARKAVVAMAVNLGFSEVEIAELEIIVSELGTNIVKHGGSRGTVRFEPVVVKNRRGMQITAMDQGRRFDDLNNGKKDLVDQCYQEGYSSTGTLGIGLSGVRRMTDQYALEKNDLGGLTIIATKWPGALRIHPAVCSVISRPKTGESQSGDAYFIHQEAETVVIAVIDVLGHGRGAHPVAQRALAVVENHRLEPPAQIVASCDRRVKNTRGAAMAVGRIDVAEGRLTHIGIGNVETRIYQNSKPMHPICRNGTVGVAIPRLTEETYDCPPGSCVVMFSDGISERFELDGAMLRRTPQEIAHYIYANWGRDHDDATVAVVKLKSM